jgi:MoaA/NifB/PqqE/SkfB family radical SAM enzyme
MHPDICELIAYARGLRRFVKTMMISNGFLIKEEIVDQLNEAGLEELQISIDGVHPNEMTKKVLDRLRGRLEILARSARFRVVVSGVLGSAPAGEALEVVRYAKQSGFVPRVLVLHGDKGQMDLTAEVIDEYREIGRVIGRRFTESNDYRMRMLRHGSAPFRCRAGSRYIYVDEHGNACWCSQTRDEFSIPLGDYTPEDLARQFATAKTCNARCTVGCARTCSSKDEWRAQRG